MSCDQGWFSAKVYAWIMIRDQEYSQTQNYQKLKNRLAEAYGLDTEDFIQNDVDNGLDCSYDYIEYYWFNEYILIRHYSSVRLQ